ncbi:response regulator [Methylomonas sp. MK1]|uniref:response regulator n=1 Tax=Methylomonas sp. MK1 TaxID=1131552 RepID=UPI00037F8929|nr:response regulator [Methylomonas sp. MK1]
MPTLNILVVDDEESIRDMLLMVLENAGMNVTTVATAEEAQQSLAQMSVDLLVLDWMLPGISGIEMTRRLKNDPKFTALPVILLTARAERNDRIRAFEVGVNDYITKPFSPRDLIIRINSAINISRNLN